VVVRNKIARLPKFANTICVFLAWLESARFFCRMPSRQGYGRMQAEISAENKRVRQLEKKEKTKRKRHKKK
jgi:hypothetical protein